VKNLSAPTLGITSSSAILLWDDFVEPDLQQEDASLTMWRYDIYQDGVKVGSTHRRTYTVKSLEAGQTYAFAVSCNMDHVDLSALEVIHVTTKAAGKVFNVRDYGAAGDGKTPDTEAIQKTINACSKGGTVLVPAGVYLVAPLQLKSDMTLQLQKDAILRLVPYEAEKPYPPEGSGVAATNNQSHHRTRALISGYEVHNCTLTGDGVIDANGDTWWPHFRPPTEEVNGVRRPYTVLFSRSSNILVQGITMQDPPFHNNILSTVDNAIYSDVKFLKVSTVRGRNGDGLNPSNSRNILIVGCLFGNQDDSIAIKGRPKAMSEYITIRDCVFDGHAATGSRPLGFAMGSYPKARHVRMKNCIFIDAISLAYIKTKPRQQPYSYVDDVRIENITFVSHRKPSGYRNRGPITIDEFYYKTDNDDPAIAKPLTPQTPQFRDIHFRNIHIVNTTGWGIYLCGLAESPIRQVSFENVTVQSKDGMFVENVEGLSTQALKVLPCDQP